MSLMPTIVCDWCETHYIINLQEGEELPPGWISIHVVIADSEGIIPPHDESHLHFCQQDCFADYAKSDIFKEQMLLADRPDDGGFQPPEGMSPGQEI